MMNKQRGFITPSLRPLLFIAALLAVSLCIAGSGAFSPAFLQNIENQFGTPAKNRLLAWQQLVDSHQGESEWSVIHSVNDFFNQVRFISDKRHWHRDDYWATPVEFLATNGGDCEDFSIAKYFTLRELGVPDEHLRITYVKALELNQAHMVLAYYETPESEPLILDNLIPEIKPASSRDDLLPIYSFNGKNLWMAKERGQGRKVAGGSQRINLWRDLNVRLQQERNLGSSYTADSMQGRK